MLPQLPEVTKLGTTMPLSCALLLHGDVNLSEDIHRPLCPFRDKIGSKEAA